MSQLQAVFRLAFMHYPPPRTDRRRVFLILLCRLAVLIWGALVALGVVTIGYLTYLWAASR